MPAEKAVYQLAVRTTIQVLATGAVLMGILLTLGGPRRFAVPSLATARTIPGGVYTWAAIIAASGAATWAGIALRWRRRVVMIGLACQGTWAAFFDLTLWTQVVTDPTTPLTGAVVYGMLAAVHVVLYSAGHELRAREGRDL